MRKGDIVLVPFPFTNLSDAKIRPCLVLAEAEYDVTVSFITTQTGWGDQASVAIKSSDSNGLKKDSLIRLNKLAILDKELIIGILGALSNSEIIAVNEKLKEIFQI